MKRKLSLGICLITNPKCVFLDEPSCGVDAVAKRVLWNKILNRSKGQTVILTTHSMEEADAICNRVGIMVNGSLRCLGTTMHIKQKYGNGYQLELLLNTERVASTVQGAVDNRAVDLENVEDLVIANLCDYIWGENQANHESHDFKLLEKNIFTATRAKLVIGLGVIQSKTRASNAGSPKAARKNKKASTASSEDGGKIHLGKIFQWCHANRLEIIEDYALGQPTLEQVFLKFARKQEELEIDEAADNSNQMAM